MSIHSGIRRDRRRSKGVALLLVLTTIAVLALVLVEFSSSSHTHLVSGVNVRDEVRATQMADTALVMTRACLDDTAWGPMAGSQAHQKMDFKKLCDIMLGMFIRKRVDLPVGGLSLELNDIKGLGLEKGDVEEIELTTEDSYIGLGGLRCDSPLRCPSRVAVALQLRTVLCDPAIAHLFDKEQEDGKRYTREEVVGNIVDWQDADDNRIYIDPLDWGKWSDGAGEGEDAYLRDLEHPYVSKDEPLDSIEELRLIRGINDELYEFLKDKVSVYTTNGKVNPNGTSVQVMSALIQTYAPQLMVGDYEGCGEEKQDFSLTGGATSARDAAEKYARIIEDAKNTKIQFKIINAFTDANSFVNLAKDPLQLVYNSLLQMAQVTNVQIPPKEALLLGRYGLTPQDYSLIQGVFANNAIRQALTFKSNVYRLRVRGTVGKMTKQVFAILRDEGKTVRTLYYREE